MEINSGRIALEKLSLRMSARAARCVLSAALYGKLAFPRKKNKMFHTFSTGRLQYDTRSLIVSKRNEHNSKRRVNEGN
jgi:hypothetical protein